jgi:hypothetical protein
MEMEDSAASDASQSRTEEDAQQMTSPKTKKARTESVIPTPTRNSISKVAAQRDDVYFDYTAVDLSDAVRVYYKKIETLEVNVDVEDFHSLISLTTEGPQWMVAQGTATSDTKHVVKKADPFRGWMSGVLPPHFAPVFNQPFLFPFSVHGKKKSGRQKCGRQRKYPSLLIGVHGYCAAKGDGCMTTFAAGFTDKALRLFQQNDSPPFIPLTMHFAESCNHLHGKLYGSLKGPARAEVVDQFIA